ncbi:HAMP domain-containing sensor histidine kinase [Actinosynnema sp. NPDC020468]|uniref:sensor histidine kinase n=1 Tax=Actinosynnema sp. NPDC020468 TaxID=3154488 RepID=UPI0033C466A7
MLVLLTTAGLLGTWLIGSQVMERYLLGQVDGRLSRIADGAERQVAQAVSRGVTRGFFQQDVALLRDSTGRTVELSTPSDGPKPDLPGYGGLTGSPTTVGSVSGDRRWRVLARRVGDAELVVAVSQADVDDAVDDLRETFLLISLGAVLLMAVAGHLLVRRSTRPLEEVEATAEAIAAGDLSRRVPVRQPGSEVGRLATSLNVMLGHIETAFQARAASEEEARRSEVRMRRFVADASHELRTPLTSIRGYAELFRQGAAPAPDALRRIEEQSVRMGVLVEELLLLARLDQDRALRSEPVDLVVLAADAVRDARAVAPGREIALDAAAVVVPGDEARLRQVFANLVGNALAHTPDSAPVQVRVRPGAVVEVVDHGPGMTADQADRVFERFYRADAARSSQGGTGLGLAIVRAIVEAHGGTVTLTTAPGEGATFRVELPER